MALVGYFIPEEHDYYTTIGQNNEQTISNSLQIQSVGFSKIVGDTQKIVFIIMMDTDIFVSKIIHI